MEKDYLQKFLEQTEFYANYNIKVKEILEGYLKDCEDENSKLHYEKEISFLTGRSMGLFMTAMTIRKILNLEIPQNGNYQICFEDVLK